MARLKNKFSPSVLQNKSLAFFCTCGLSIQKWADLGMLSREIELYNRLAPYFRKIYFFTYGKKGELKFKNYLAPNIEIVGKKGNWPNLIYSLLLPFYHYRLLRQCSLFKSNQFLGAWSACLGRLFFKRQGKFILRAGFIWSLFLKKENRLIYPLALIAEFLLYRVCDLATATSHTDQNYLRKKYRLNNKIKYLPNYVDTDQFQPIRTITKKQKNIIFVGRLHRQKNLFALILALRNTGIALDIIGQGKLRPKLEKYAREHKVKINFLGIVAHQKLPLILNRYSIFVLPSFYEGLPKTLLEAASCGLACIAADIAGNREIISHNINGLLVSSDVHALRKAIIKLNSDPSLRKTLGENARATIVQRYSLSSLVKKEIAFYQNLRVKI